MTQRVAIGIDVGGTKIAIAAVNVDTGSILLHDEIPTLRDEGGSRVLTRLYDFVFKVKEELSIQHINPVGVGIGIPELVSNSGAIKSNWNFDWSERDVAAQLADLGPVILESDARTVTLAELIFGHGKTLPSFVFVTVGSGLSFAFCNNGVIHRGANGYAIHFASNDIMAVCISCGAQNGFNLEALACGRGLAETYHRQTGQWVEARELLEKQKDPTAAKLLDQAVVALGSYLGQLVNIFDPHALIVGGGLGRNPQFFEMLCRHTRSHIWATDTKSLPMVISAIPKFGAAIGAAALFR